MFELQRYLGGLYTRLLLRNFLFWFAGLVVGFAALVLASRVLENVGTENQELGDTLRIALLKTPADLIAWTLVAFTFAGLAVSYRHSARSEIVVLRVSRQPHWRLAAPFGLAAGLTGLLISLWVQPWAGRLLEAGERLEHGGGSDVQLVAGRVHLAYAEAEGRIHFLNGVREVDGSLSDLILTTTNADAPPSTLVAESLRAYNQVLVAEGVTLLSASGQEQLNRLALRFLPASLLEQRPQEPLHSLNIPALIAQAESLEERGYSAVDHYAALHQRIAQPLLLAAAALAGAAIGFRARGRTRTDRLIFAGVGFALTVYLGSVLLGSFAVSGWLAPSVAGWVPALAAFSLSLWLLLSSDYV